MYERFSQLLEVFFSEFRTGAASIVRFLELVAHHSSLSISMAPQPLHRVVVTPLTVLIDSPGRSHLGAWVKIQHRLSSARYCKAMLGNRNRNMVRWDLPIDGEVLLALQSSKPTVALPLRHSSVRR